MMAVRLDAFLAYQRDEAWTWEHMALCRARPVFGSAGLRKRTSALIREILEQPRDRARVIADAARMRAEMERHKPAASPLDVKLGPGGLIDLEFAVHVLQLTQGVGLDPSLEDAITALITEGSIAKKVLTAQKLLTRMLVMMRLVAPGTVKPTSQTWQLVAEACGAATWDELLAEHDSARQSIRQLWDSIKDEA
jgi:glutamate-ammonia-ligase adenylyltransferase